MKKSKKALIGLAILGAGLVGSPSFSQNTEKIKNDTKNSSLANLGGKELTHDTIVKMDFKDILKIYGKEKGMEIIREHFVQEINIYRRIMDRPPLVLDDTLNEAAQRFADYGAKHKGLGHEFEGKGVRDMGVDLDGFSARAENVGYGQDSIYEIIADRYNKSQSHKKTMLGLHISQYTGEPIPYTSIGVGISGLFIVVEFATKK
ncbi:MAG: CAP domain-containing protein [Candidatus Absconditicoccaceae bacterium]